MFLFVTIKVIYRLNGFDFRAFAEISYEGLKRGSRKGSPGTVDKQGALYIFLGGNENL